MFKQKKWFLGKEKSMNKNLSLKSLVLSLFLFCLINPCQTLSDSSAALSYDYSPWASFAPSIEQCSLGQFTLPDPAAITLLKLRLQSLSNLGPEAQARINGEIGGALVTIQIYGWVNNLCHVVYKSERQEQNADNLSLGPLGFDCNFTADEIKVLAGIARKLAANQIPLTAEDPTAKIKGSACKALVQQVPPSPTNDSTIPVYFIH